MGAWARLPKLSHFCCLPGRAGAWLLALKAYWDNVPLERRIEIDVVSAHARTGIDRVAFVALLGSIANRLRRCI
jgi:hypothetical protein